MMNHLVARITNTRLVTALLVGLSLGLGGCSDADVTGTAPTTQDVLAIWQVSSGSPDYVYKFGEGTADGESFELTLDGDPPAEALNSNGVGIAFVIALPEGMSMPDDGKLDQATSESISDSNPFISDRQAIIFKRDGAEGNRWSESFDPGMSCGLCVEAPEGETFDSYTPADCSDFELRREDEGDVCNWT